MDVIHEEIIAGSRRALRCKLKNRLPIRFFPYAMKIVPILHSLSVSSFILSLRDLLTLSVTVGFNRAGIGGSRWGLLLADLRRVADSHKPEATVLGFETGSNRCTERLTPGDTLQRN